MASIQLEIEGTGATAATDELLGIDGLEGKWELASEETEREGTLAVIATVVGITVGSLTIAEKLHGWYQKHHRPESGARIEKVLIVGKNGTRILLSDATVEQIQKILDE